jgi:phosphoribosylcarboxyaminoimidazole (NCAIR) mutase
VRSLFCPAIHQPLQSAGYSRLQSLSSVVDAPPGILPATAELAIELGAPAVRKNRTIVFDKADFILGS